jgi:hypothetical protein
MRLIVPNPKVESSTDPTEVFARRAEMALETVFMASLLAAWWLPTLPSLGMSVTSLILLRLGRQLDTERALAKRSYDYIRSALKSATIRVAAHRRKETVTHGVSNARGASTAGHAS